MSATIGSSSAKTKMVTSLSLTVLNRSQSCLDIDRNVSNWTDKTLDKLNISYMSDSARVDDLFKMSKVRSLPKNAEFILDFLNNIFTTDFVVPNHQGKELEVALDCLSLTEDKMERELAKLLEPETDIDVDLSNVASSSANTAVKIYTIVEKRVLCQVIVQVIDFLQSVSSYFRDKVSESNLNEASLAEVVRKFTDICFLSGRTGKCIKRQMKIGSLDVSSIPDFRYEKDFARKTLVVSLVEVKSKPCKMTQPSLPVNTRKRKSDSVESKFGDEKLRGQLGGEMLLEWKNSFFSPFVIGFAVSGPEIIFATLHTTQEHIENIEEGTDLGDGCAEIYYTEPYSIWKPEDRKVIFHALLRLALEQRSLRFLDKLIKDDSSH